MNILEITKFLIVYHFLIVDMLPFGSENVDPYNLADSDPGSQFLNLF